VTGTASTAAARNSKERRLSKWLERIARWRRQSGPRRSIAIDRSDSEMVEAAPDGAGDGPTETERRRARHETEIALIYPLIH
jgi:hypothetical protein